MLKYEVKGDTVEFEVFKRPKKGEIGLRFYIVKINLSKLNRVIENVEQMYIVSNSYTNYCKVRLKDGRKTFLHRFITNCPDDLVVDHGNHNGLDNTDLNLKVCTNYTNLKNKRKYSKNRTGYKNVFPLSNGRYRASKTIDGNVYYIGTFDSVEDAAENVRKFEAERI